MVALTFDDGPHEIYTAEILDILEENHAVATFFELGSNISKCPEQLARAASMGCELGSHSYSHGNLATMDLEDILADLEAADREFVHATGTSPSLLRPPGGQYNQQLLRESGKTIVTWTIDTRDWESRDAQTIVEYIKSLDTLDGQIVLMHSIYGSSVEATRELVPWLQEQGYQLVTVSELLTNYYKK